MRHIRQSTLILYYLSEGHLEILWFFIRFAAYSSCSLLGVLPCFIRFVRLCANGQLTVSAGDRTATRSAANELGIRAAALSTAGASSGTGQAD